MTAPEGWLQAEVTVSQERSEAVEAAWEEAGAAAVTLLPAADVRVLGRGRVTARVHPALALRAAAARGDREVSGRVVTPDQPDFEFKVELLTPERKP